MKSRAAVKGRARGLSLIAGVALIVAAIGDARPLAANTGDIRPQHPVEGGPYYLTFHDEFNRLSIQNPLDGGRASDTSRGWWHPIFHWGGWPLNRDFIYRHAHRDLHQTNPGNNEAGFYLWNEYRLDTGERLADVGGPVYFIRDGKLVIRARPMTSYESANISRPNPSRYKYVAAVLSTWATFGQRGGYWELRAKLPRENPSTMDRSGVWPAFWLINNDRWDLRQEIDIFEIVPNTAGRPWPYGYDRAFAHFHDHGRGYSIGNGQSGGIGFPNNGRADDGFHTYSLEWIVNNSGPDTLIWRVDGREAFRLRYPIDGSMSILLNLPIGGPGGWPGTPHSGNTWPADFEIDYIRVFANQRPASVKGPGGGSSAPVAGTGGSGTQACGALDRHDPVPAGFGAAYDVFAPDRLLLDASCSNSNVRLSVGYGNSKQIVYRHGHVWRNGRWQAITFNGSQSSGDDWLIGRAEATVPNSGSDPAHFLAYVCTETDSGWKCGCRDTSCRSSNWQLQSIVR